MIPSSPPIVRPLGTMVVYGNSRGDVGHDLAIATEIGATHIEVLPNWRNYPDPAVLRERVAAAGLVLNSAHGCWGGEAINARRVDLGNPNPEVAQASRSDMRCCIDWLAAAGGRFLVVHPGGLSDPEDTEARREVLAESLIILAEHAHGTGVTVCVENMPPGVHPGSRMADLHSLLTSLARPELGLALDTGHAHLGPSAASETLAAGSFLRTTHVHDNRGSNDTHHPPGRGTIDWDEWSDALDQVGYTGLIMLECIRFLREHPESRNPDLLERLERLTRRQRISDSPPGHEPHARGR